MYGHLLARDYRCCSTVWKMSIQKVQSALLGTSDFLQLYLYISTEIMWQIEDKTSWSILAYTPTLLQLPAAYRPCTLLWSLKQPPSVLSYWVDT